MLHFILDRTHCFCHYYVIPYLCALNLHTAYTVVGVKLRLKSWTELQEPDPANPCQVPKPEVLFILHFILQQPRVCIWESVLFQAHTGVGLSEVFLGWGGVWLLLWCLCHNQADLRCCVKDCFWNLSLTSRLPDPGPTPHHGRGDTGHFMWTRGEQPYTPTVSSKSGVTCTGRGRWSGGSTGALQAAKQKNTPSQQPVIAAYAPVCDRGPLRWHFRRQIWSKHLIIYGKNLQQNKVMAQPGPVSWPHLFPM